MMILASLRALLRFIIFIPFTTGVVLLLFFVNTLHLYGMSQRLLLFWHATCLRILNFSVTVTGNLSSVKGKLIVANHCSYMDILVLGSLTQTTFTPKKNIQSWPLIGQMVAVSRPIFIDRGNKRRMKQEGARISQALSEGRNIVLFPEGTTNDGAVVLPFKGGAFAFLEQPDYHHIPVVPVTIAYTMVEQQPLVPHTPSPIAWYGDTTLLPHLWKIFTLQRVMVHVTVHAPLTLAAHGSRKNLAQHAHQAIAHQLAKDTFHSSSSL